MTKFKFIGISLLVVMLFGCAGVQEKWNALTPDQKARIIINDLQGQLDNAFTQGKAYVTANPQYAEKWKKEVIPALDIANKALRDVIEIGKTKNLTPQFIYDKVMVHVTAVMTLIETLKK